MKKLTMTLILLFSLPGISGTSLGSGAQQISELEIKEYYCDVSGTHANGGYRITSTISVFAKNVTSAKLVCLNKFDSVVLTDEDEQGNRIKNLYTNKDDLIKVRSISIREGKL